MGLKLSGSFGGPVQVQVAGRREKKEALEAYEDLDERGKRQRQDQQERYSKGLFWVMVIQLLVVDAFFVVYAIKGHDWKVPDGVMYVWLTSTFVEVVGAVAIVTSGLFGDSKN